MRKIFVTGGAGFIGSAFIHLVLEETSDVKIVDGAVVKRLIIYYANLSAQRKKKNYLRTFLSRHQHSK